VQFVNMAWFVTQFVETYYIYSAMY